MRVLPRRFAWGTTLACCIALAATSVSAQKLYSPEELPSAIKKAVSVGVQLSENQLRSGLDGRTDGSLDAQIQIETRGDFHVYEDRVKIRLQTEDAWQLEILSKPKTTPFLDPVTKTVKNGYRGQSIFGVRARLSGPLPKPPSEGPRLVVGFQACNKEICLLPVNVIVELPLSKNARAQAAPVDVSWIDRATAALQKALGDGELGFEAFLVVLLAGLITAFTPCVYPLYPLTIGVFSRWSGGAKGSALALTLSYSAGLTLSYALLGLVSASTGALFGSLTQTPEFLIGVGALIMLSALAFSGLVEIRLPERLQRFFGGASGPVEAGRVGVKRLLQAAFMGSGLGVVAAPCVGPVLVAILAWLSTALAAESSGGQNAQLQGFALLCTFGFGMSLPLLVLGHMILRMGLNPRWGKFTPWVKHLGTGLMVAASLFFLVPGLQLLRRAPGHLERNYPVYDLKTWPRDAWTVLDFRADWCAACWDLSAETFASDAVSKLFREGDWDLVEVDLTLDNDESRRIADDFDVIGLPTVLLLDPQGRICRSEALFGFEGPLPFKERLARARADCR
jgi:thiol:disulfide interchange protein